MPLYSFVVRFTKTGTDIVRRDVIYVRAVNEEVADALADDKIDARCKELGCDSWDLLSWDGE